MRQYEVVRDYVHSEIAQMVERGGERGPYYAALDLQHFGEGATASNFLEFSCIEDALVECGLQRGSLLGNDLELLKAIGAEETALLGPDKCRYLVFAAKGRLGVVDLDDLGGDVEIELVEEKPGTALSLVVAREQARKTFFQRPAVDIATVIVGSGGELWTLHPGLPTAPHTDPVFERAGFHAGDIFSVEALSEPETTAGKELRRAFASAEVVFPALRRVKIPAGLQVDDRDKVLVGGAV